jgi:hypothetical protein
VTFAGEQRGRLGGCKPAVNTPPCRLDHARPPLT